MTSIFISVVLPSYNQLDSLKITLDYFGRQTLNKDKFEVIVIDDGSTDGTGEFLKKYVPSYNYKCISQEHQGCAAARNKGVELASGEYIVFCDGDRIPDIYYVEQYYWKCRGNNFAIVGCPYDYFGKSLDVNENVLRKYSRKPIYYKIVQLLYDENGITDSEIAWCSFLIGNSCIKRDTFINIGGLDEKFTSWGFEHYDLGIRLLEKNIRIVSAPEIGSYHVPHKRSNRFYSTNIKESMKLLSSIHSTKPVSLLEEFLFGKISLQEFEQMYSQRLCSALSQVCKKEVYLPSNLFH